MLWLQFLARQDPPAESDTTAPAVPSNDTLALWLTKKRNRHLNYLFGFIPAGSNVKQAFRAEMGYDMEITGGYGHEYARTWLDLAGGGDLANLNHWSAPHLSPTGTGAAQIATDPGILDLPCVWISTPALPAEHCIQANGSNFNDLYFWNPHTRRRYATIQEAAQIWGRVAAGEFDVYYRTFYSRWARMLASRGRDTRLMCLDIDPEMSGSWKIWNPGPDLQTYKDAWKRRVDILRESFIRHGTGAPLVMWRPDRWVHYGPQFHNNTWTEYQRVRPRIWDAFPGEDHVDVVGVSLHNPNSLSSYGQWLAYIDASKERGDWTDGPRTVLDWFNANTRRVMFGFSEWGYFDQPRDGGWQPLADPAAAFQWTKRDLLDRYGNRMLFAVYTSWGQFVGVPAFKQAILAQWRAP